MSGCEAAWRAAMDRAYAASAEFRAEEERKAGEVYRFEVGFTLPDAICRDARIETERVADGLRVEVEFYGTEDARRKVTDFVAELPTVCRSFRRYYSKTQGEVRDGDA